MRALCAFLRGINVGKIRIKMDDLARCFEEMGHAEVGTFLQSGNVVFKTKKDLTSVKRELEAALTARFNYEAFVLLTEHEVLASIIAHYPFERDEANHAYVLFVSDKAISTELLQAALSCGQEVKDFEGGLYLKMPKGETLDTPFSKTLSKPKYKSMTTMRNIQTLEKMVK